jgi:S1-C subfamily serine protease
MPIFDNLSQISTTYLSKINAVVRVVAISNTNLNQIKNNSGDYYSTKFNLFNSGGGFFVFNGTDGYISTSAQIILKSASLISDNIPTQIQDNIFVRVFPENLILKAVVIGLERRMDIALLKINLNDPSLDMPLGPREFLDFINNRDVSIGTSVIALSHPQYRNETPGSVFFNINTYRPDIQSIYSGIITENKFTNDNKHVESVTVNNNYMPPFQGGPLLINSGLCLGMASWSLTNDRLYTTKGFVASNLIEKVINFLH